jgi:hypothetical protein
VEAALARLDLVWLLVLVLATHRVTRLAVEDTIADRPRNWVFMRTPWPEWTEKLLSCPWCFGWWASLACAVLYLNWPVVTVALALPWALSSAVGLLAARELQGEVQAFGAEESRA